MDETLLKKSEEYLDALFGEGMGRRHSRFLGHLKSEPLQRALHEAHVMEADETHLSVEENYLIGMCVLLVQRNYEPAAMFAKTLRHRGVASAKVLEAVTRLSMWMGAVPAAEAAAHVQRALRDYDKRGLESLAGWFPQEEK